MPGLDLAQDVLDIVSDRRRPSVQVDNLDPVEYHRVGKLSSGQDGIGETRRLSSMLTKYKRNDILRR
jgi:hypothetical protein